MDVQHEAHWDDAGNGELVRTDRFGKIAEILRSKLGSSGRMLTTSAFDGNTRPLRTTRGHFLPFGMFMSNTDGPSGPICTSSTTVLQNSSGTVVIRSEGGNDGTIHQTVNGSGVDGGIVSSFSSDMTIGRDGSGSLSGVASGTAGDTTVTMTTNCQLNADGSGSGFISSEVTNNGTGESNFDTMGVNSAGENFRTAGGADGQGNESQTTVTELRTEDFRSRLYRRMPMAPTGAMNSNARRLLALPISPPGREPPDRRRPRRISRRLTIWSTAGL
jgi:hypothetical protein